VLDRAPVLFGARRHLAKIGRHAIAVGTIETIEFFDGVQVRQIGAVEDQIVAPLHLRNAVDREADGLVRRNEQIDEQKESSRRR
jgi:hypothetical protein